MKFGKREIIYLLCYVICIVTIFVFSDIYNKPRALWLVFSILTIGIYATITIHTRLTKKDLLFRFAVIVLFTIAAIISNKPQMMIYSALICTADLTSFRRIVLTCFFTCIITIILVFIADTIGIIPKRTFYRGSQIAHAFGFGYYNVVPFSFFFMVLEFFYLKASRHKKASWFEIAGVFIINYIIYSLSTLRLAFYLVIVTLGIYIIFEKFDWIKLNSKPMVFLCTITFPVLFALSLWMSYSFSSSNDFFIRLNQLLSDRLKFGNQALANYPIRIFGQQIITIRTDSELFYLDSGFLFSLLSFGLLFTGGAIIIYVLLCNYAAKSNNKVLFIWLFTVAIFSIINNTWISLYINPILLYFPFLLKNRNALQLEYLWEQFLYPRKHKTRLNR